LSTSDDRLLAVARTWCVVMVPLLLFYWWRQVQFGLSDGAGHPFGEDFINFWSGARLGLTGEWTRVYDIAAFHEFEEAVVRAKIDLYHYSYPPVTWLLTAPFAAVPYVAGWVAWQLGGLAAFALAVRRIAPAHWVLAAVAPPAVFINALGGQNGCWTAAAIGWGLILLRSRPLLAGAVMAVFVVKPQLAWLVPLALLAGRQYRALGAFVLTGAGLLALSVLLFGVEPWLAYVEQGRVLKAVILEGGSGTWHRMLSVFVAVRHAGASVGAAYVAQALASAVVAVLVVRTWWREGANERAKAVLVMGMLAGSLYVSDYDCVMVTLAACWLWPSADRCGRLFLGIGILAPLVTAAVATASGYALCAVALWPMLLWAATYSGLSRSSK
jgi:hypothetical protein